MQQGFARWLPQLVLAPSFAATLFFVYGFILWTGYISFTPSTFMPAYVGPGELTLAAHERLWSDSRWLTAVGNLGIFGTLFIGISMGLGLFLAILLDQRIRIEGALRAVYLYPMALSFIVTGIIWRWLLTADVGIQKFVRDLGWESFEFAWIGNRDMAIYTLVIAAVWQSSGFVMALFLAGLRGVDSSIMSAARIDGASIPRIYRRVVLPMLAPVFFSAFVILSHLAIKSYDLVVALTGGGPGNASDLPARYMQDITFARAQMAQGAGSAMFLLAVATAIVVPYLYSELRSGRRRT